jgi:enoyl-CoA hydratase/carnithine racemase
MGQIIAEVSDRVATAIICAPPMNALDAAMRAELVAINSAQNDGEGVALAMAREYAARLAASADITEGVRSFLEKRSPVFSDKIDRET